ncbi:MAG: hypothetical protein AAB909_04645 [Patescibacteria group bacterium]
MKWFGVVLILLFSTSPALAVTLTLSNTPSSIDLNQFSFSVFVDGPSDGTNYLRADLFKEGSTNYFGETFNGTDWHSDSTGTNYLPVTIQSSTGSAQLTARIGAPSQSEYPGPGQYKLRVRRYTSSGNPASGDEQNIVDVAITYSQPTPTSQPASTPTNTPVPITPTPKPTNTPKPSTTPKPTSTNTPTSTPAVLGSTTEPSLIPTSTPVIRSTHNPQPTTNNYLAYAIIGLGAIMLGSSGFLFLKDRKSA